MSESAGAKVTESSCRASRPLVTRHPSLVTTVLIYGSAIKTDDPSRIVVLSDRRESKGRSRLHLIYVSAIKTRANLLLFNYLQFSNRR
jgi:hypothetical protein